MPLDTACYSKAKKKPPSHTKVFFINSEAENCNDGVLMALKEGRKKPRKRKKKKRKEKENREERKKKREIQSRNFII